MNSLGLLPHPQQLQVLGGSVSLGSDLGTGADLRISADDGARGPAQLLAHYLRESGLAVVDPVEGGGADVVLSLDAAGLPSGVEAYAVTVREGGVLLRARTATGLGHCVQTLRQLAHVGPTARAGSAWQLPCVAITDAPRLGWRGALLDVGRWFLPVAELQRYVEVLALHKMNRLHLHLTEDQGWRLEVARYPLLTEVGAWRRESMVGHESDTRFDATPHGGFYTQRELRDLVAFAAQRGVAVVPEIDVPGHASAAIAAYPHLGSGTSGARPEVSTSWGVHTSVLNPQASTLQFVLDVLDEVADVFDSPWIHLGGDECPTDEWEASPAARARASELGLSGPQQLQRWFTQRTCAHVEALGRRPVVWDEAADDALPRDVVVMAWRNAELGVAAAERGHDVVMTPQQVTYLDHHATRAPWRPVAHDGDLTLRAAFDHDPLVGAAQLADRVLGVQAMLWSEYLPTAADVDAAAFPRLCAIADRAWSGHSGPDGEADAEAGYLDFLARLAVHAPRAARWERPVRR